MKQSREGQKGRWVPVRQKAVRQEAERAMSNHGDERGEEGQSRMNTQNRSLSDIAQRSQSGLPRRGMRTGSGSRGLSAREAAPVYTAPKDEQRPNVRSGNLPEPFESLTSEGSADQLADAPKETAGARPAKGVAATDDLSAADAAPQRSAEADRSSGPSGWAPDETREMRVTSHTEPVDATAASNVVSEDAEGVAAAHDRDSAEIAIRDAAARRNAPAGSSASASVSRSGPLVPGPAATWAALRRVPLDVAHLDRHRMISARREDPSHAAFDVLRTRLMQALVDNGWRKVAITSPTKNCGKSFVAANLALSLSRAENRRTLLIDMDLRNPSLAKLLGVRNPGPIGDLLRGRTPPDHHVVRFEENALGVGPSLALGLNDRIERDAGELLQTGETAAALDGLDVVLGPDVVLFDLPPALYHDDVLAFRGQYDGVLLVVGGGITKPDEITEVSRRLADHTPLLGVVLNRAEGPSIRDYSY